MKPQKPLRLPVNALIITSYIRQSNGGDAFDFLNREKFFHYIKYGFPLNRILPYKERIYDSTLYADSALMSFILFN